MVGIFLGVRFSSIERSQYRIASTFLFASDPASHNLIKSSSASYFSMFVSFRKILLLPQVLIHKQTSVLQMSTTVSLPDFGPTAFGLTKTLSKDVTFDEAVVKTKDALKSVGFGVLTEIDLDATFRKKKDVGLDRPYQILGACNPDFALQAVQMLPSIGLLLPCNVVVTTTPDGAPVVSIVDPIAMFSMVNEPKVKDMAQEVRGVLQTALDTI
jgi:uncharacterized protein (DUF302 family)